MQMLVLFVVLVLSPWTLLSPGCQGARKDSELESRRAIGQKREGGRSNFCKEESMSKLSEEMEEHELKRVTRGAGGNVEEYPE